MIEMWRVALLKLTRRSDQCLSRSLYYTGGAQGARPPFFRSLCRARAYKFNFVRMRTIPGIVLSGGRAPLFSISGSATGTLKERGSCSNARDKVGGFVDRYKNLDMVLTLISFLGKVIYSVQCI